MRRYDEPVTVQRGWVPDAGEGPAQFLWRDRLWQVRAVLAHWVETGEWWRTDGSESSPGLSAAPVDLLAEREVWRVEARRPLPSARSRRRLDRTGVFELRFDTRDGSWRLVGCHD